MKEKVAHNRQTAQEKLPAGGGRRIAPPPYGFSFLDKPAVTGREKQLPHEARQGRVNQVSQMKETSASDDEGSEREADAMGDKAETIQRYSAPLKINSPSLGGIVQRVIGAGHKPGAEVIDNKSRTVYTIVEVIHDQYKIVPVNMEQAPIGVQADDERFDLYRRAPEGPALQDEKEASASSGLFGALGRLVGRNEPPGGVSDAFQKARQKEVISVWPGLKDKSHDVTKKAESIINSEKNTHDDAIFYNAAGLGSYTLHQIIKTIYEAYHKVKIRDFEFLRAPGNQPRKDALKGPQKFLASRKGGLGWSDHSERESLLSVNMALMGNVQDTSESTFAIMASGGLFDIEAAKTVAIVGAMLDALGMPASFAAAILKEVTALAEMIDKIKKDSSGKKESVVYQIFIPRTLIGQLVYIAQKNGHPLDTDVSQVRPDLLLKGICDAGKELKNDGMAAWGAKMLTAFEAMAPDEKMKLLQGEQFTQYALLAARSISFWTVLTGRVDPQARILMHPEVFSKPSGRARIKTHKNLSVHTEAAIASGLHKITSITDQRKLLLDIHEMAMHYGVLRERIRIADLSKFPAEKLKVIKSELYDTVRSRDEFIQQHVWDVIAESDRLKEMIKKGLPVSVQGTKENLDLDSPVRMSTPELQMLVEMLQREKAPPALIPDLLTFDKE